MIPENWKDAIGKRVRARSSVQGMTRDAVYVVDSVSQQWVLGQHYSRVQIRREDSILGLGSGMWIGNPDYVLEVLP